MAGLTHKNTCQYVVDKLGIIMTPFDDLVKRATEATGAKSWLLYLKAWAMKSLYNFSSRKFQALIMAVIICLVFKTDTWIILACLGGYAGINVLDKLKGG
jgi:hypothetical protein